MSAAAELARALERFDARAFSDRHGGRKESRSQRSHEWLFTCPLCGGHNLRWNAKKNNVGGFVCWNCRAHGDTLYLIQLLERCDRQAAIDVVFGSYVGGDARLELSQIAMLPDQAAVARRARLRRLPAIALPPSVPALRHPLVRAYLNRRGIDDAMIAEWGLLAGTTGPTANRVIFPCLMDGATAYWQARAVWEPPQATREEQRAWVERTHFRKTLNPPVPCYAPGEPGPESGYCRACRRQLSAHPPRPPGGQEPASAGEVLYNFDRARHCPHVVICEGPVDAIKVGHHAVALLGKGTDQKIQRLRQVPASRYTVYLDRGREEWQKALEIASALSGYAMVDLAEPPEGRDAGALTPAENAHIISHAIPLKDAGLRSDLRV